MDIIMGHIKITDTHTMTLSGPVETKRLVDDFGTVLDGVKGSAGIADLKWIDNK